MCNAKQRFVRIRYCTARFDLENTALTAATFQTMMPSDLVSRPRRLQRTLQGIAAVSRLGSFVDPYAGQASSSKPSQAVSSSRPYMKLRSRSRGNPLDERAIQVEIEEKNRLKASKFVSADKWEEATTVVWFPPAPGKRLWDMLVLLVLLYSIVVEPFRIGFNHNATGYAYIFETFGSLIFISDILSTFNTAYLEAHLEGDSWVIDHCTSAGLDPPTPGSCHPCCPPCLLTPRSLGRHRAWQP